MNKEDRLSIITETAKRYPQASMQEIIDCFIIEELRHAAMNVFPEDTDISEEFNKVLDLYSFDAFPISDKIKAYVKHYSKHPVEARMQHVDLNHFILNIGCYYDGSPADKYRYDYNK